MHQEKAWLAQGCGLSAWYLALRYRHLISDLSVLGFDIICSSALRAHQFRHLRSLSPQRLTCPRQRSFEPGSKTGIRASYTRTLREEFPVLRPRFPAAFRPPGIRFMGTLSCQGIQPPGGSGRGAVLALRPVRFPDPPAEPAVRLSTQRALHVPYRRFNRTRRLPGPGSTGLVSCCRGSGSGSPRRWMRR